LDNRGEHTIHFKRKSLGLDANELDTSVLGPVNTYFAPALLREEREGKVQAQGIAGLWLSFATPPRVFSCATRRDGTEFHPTHRCLLLAELTLLRGSCLVPAEIRHRRGREISVNRP
jgi:hypothetical protein